MANGMKIKSIKKSTETKVNKQGDKITKEEFVMKCEDRFGNVMVLKSIEPLSGFTTGQVVALTIKEDQKLLEEFKKAEEAVKIEKEKEKAEKKAGVKHKR